MDSTGEVIAYVQKCTINFLPMHNLLMKSWDFCDVPTKFELDHKILFWQQTTQWKLVFLTPIS